MNRAWFLIVIVIAAAAVTGYSLSGKKHEFSESKCVLCHVDVQGSPDDIKPTITLACNTCHQSLEKKKSHPSDVYPTMKIPADMPLSNGKLTCLTCHYVHSDSNRQLFPGEENFLRRQVRGIWFCTICHTIDKNRHIVFENVHTGTYTVTDRSTRVDRVSLECIECHDSHMKAPVSSLGAGTWNHFNREFNHPIGISYQKLTARKMNQYTPQSMLNKEIRLFDGKLGCGTCHNIYSKEKNMLVMSNNRSRLCLECHIK